ncbi:hypothetical protein OG473_08255 [Streptomyces anulatus]|uniref:hypothetical protein n=1 Tax=Streptomyces anulatus TaxID=1892 RepID=UPI003249B34D
MTLRSDMSELLAGAAILDVDVDVDDAVADEHVRRYSPCSPGRAAERRSGTSRRTEPETGG